MKLADLIHADDVVLGVRAPDIAAAATGLLETTLPRRGFAPAEVQRLIAAVTAREREAPTTCGVIAIPHARDAGLRTFVAAVAVNRDGIMEGQPEPRVLIAFLSPDQQRAEHLALLATLARLSRDRATIDAIAAAPDAASVVALLQR